MSRKEMRLAEIMPGQIDNVEYACRLFGMEAKARLGEIWPDGLHPSQAVVTIEVSGPVAEKAKGDKP